MNKQFYIIEIIGEDKEIEEAIKDLQEYFDKPKKYFVKKIKITRHEPIQE